MSEDAPTPKRIDLSTYTEPTRRAVYDAVVAIFFSSTPEEITAAQAEAAPETHTVITYSPDEAGLEVYYELGRWIVTWMRLEVSADIPEEFRRELLLVEEVSTVPHGILLREV
jgi:hypothetical protein